MILIATFRDGWLFFFNHNDWEYKKCLLAIDIHMASLTVLMRFTLPMRKAGFKIEKDNGSIQFESGNAEEIKQWVKMMSLYAIGTDFHGYRKINSNRSPFS